MHAWYGVTINLCNFYKDRDGTEKEKGKCVLITLRLEIGLTPSITG